MVENNSRWPNVKDPDDDTAGTTVRKCKQADPEDDMGEEVVGDRI